MVSMEPGMFARSKAGHDEGRLYIILKIENGLVYLVDGRRRTLEKPKPKKYRHIQIIHRIPEDLEPDNMTNEAVKRAIKLYEQELKNPNQTQHNMEEEHVESRCN